jgi:hypothetical protein
MRPPSPRLPAIKIDADVVPRQVQHLTPQPPVLLDLRLGFRRPSGKFPMPFADLDYPAHGCRERRVLKLEMNTEARTEVRAAIGDHVDALHGCHRLDIFQALERLDRHANDDVGIGPWRILGRVTGAVGEGPTVPRNGALKRWLADRQQSELCYRPVAKTSAARSHGGAAQTTKNAKRPIREERCR